MQTDSTTKSSDHLAGLHDALRRRVRVEDRVFDDLYPLVFRRASRMHWTPVATAMRAATLLAACPDARILDVGSGVGKFCIVAAASTGASVTGVEQRGHLVDAATRAAARVGVDVGFRRGGFTSCDPADYDGIYLFNPFAENVCSSSSCIDATVELNEARFVRDVADAEDFLRSARVGMRVVTYCGFGGEMPPGYVRILREWRSGALELWVKTADPPSGRRNAPLRDGAIVGARALRTMLDPEGGQ